MIDECLNLIHFSQNCHETLNFPLSIMGRIKVGKLIPLFLNTELEEILDEEEITVDLNI